MTRTEALQIVVSAVQEVKGPVTSPVVEATQLTESLDVDSLDLIEVFMVMEELSGLTFAQTAAAEVFTVGDAMNVLMSHATQD